MTVSALVPIASSGAPLSLVVLPRSKKAASDEAEVDVSAVLMEAQNQARR